MKLLFSFVVLLSAVLVFLGYHVVDQAISIDHLQMSVKSLEKREACLLRLSQSFASSLSPADFRQWIKTNLADLDMHEEEKLIIINQVAFDFSRHPVAVE